MGTPSSETEVDSEPSANLRTATAGRDDWTDVTPTDAGDSLFGPSDDESDRERSTE